MVDVAAAGPQEILDIRRWTVGYVSQFLRVIPRVPALEIVMEPLRARGVDRGAAETAAAALLDRLRVPGRLWGLSPTTFSGGEQQRINIARGFAADYPVMILDEPTASLDPANASVVRELITEAAHRGTAMIGIYHDPEVRTAVATRTMDVAPLCPAAEDRREGRW